MDGARGRRRGTYIVKSYQSQLFDISWLISIETAIAKIAKRPTDFNYKRESSQLINMNSISYRNSSRLLYSAEMAKICKKKMSENFEHLLCLRLRTFPLTYPTWIESRNVPYEVCNVLAHKV